MTVPEATPGWIAADWGTSRLRVWAMGTDDAVLAEAASESGMGRLAPEEFEPALLDLVGAWLPHGPKANGRDEIAPVEVVACGMVGAGQGWVHAPYAAVPTAPLGTAPVDAPVRDPRLRVRVVPGLSQDDPADVMRGEETQIAGLLSRVPDFDGVLCLPGSHTKWVRVSAGEVVAFRSFMTGEIFAALTAHTVLRHTVPASSADWDEEAFAAGVSRAMSRPEAVAADLFALRAEAMLHGLSEGVARARLSGYLVGLELAGARPFWLGERVAILGAAALSERYAAALAAQGLVPERFDAGAATLAGLIAARRGIGSPAA